MKKIVFILLLIPVAIFGQETAHLKVQDSAFYFVIQGSDTVLTIDTNGAISATPVQGQLYTDDGSVTVTTTVAGTYYTVTGLTDSNSYVFTMTDSSMTDLVDGWYDIDISANGFTSDVNNTTAHLSLFINDVEITLCELERKISTSGDIGSASATALYYLSSSDVVKAKAKSDKAGAILTINHLNINIKKYN